MTFRVYRSRCIEHAYRSVVAVKRVELGQGRAATRLNPGDLETVLVLRAQDERNREDKDNDKGQPAHKGIIPFFDRSFRRQSEP